MTLPSLGKEPGATSSTSPRILVALCSVVATACSSPRRARGLGGESQMVCSIIAANDQPQAPSSG